MYSPSIPVPPKSYLFIDGGNLSAVVRDFRQKYLAGAEVPMRWDRVGIGFNKIYYYDAVPVQNEGEGDAEYGTRVAPKRAELAEIERQAGYHVRSGDVRRHNRRRGNEQKMVDVHLAVDALLMASRGIYSKCTLLTGDLDFKPLIDALVDMGIDVHLWHPTGAANGDLIAAADTAQSILLPTILSWLDAEALNFRAPQCVHNFPSRLPDPGGVLLADWHDPRFGRAVVYPRGEGFFLITERVPNNPGTHNLEAWAHDASLLRDWIADVYDLIVPQW